jgi:hypothetical protein
MKLVGTLSIFQKSVSPLKCFTEIQLETLN